MQIDQAIANVIPIDFRVSSKQPSDIALIQSIAQHDKRAMQALFCRYKVPVYRFALRLTRKPETAEDIVSDVFLQVWRQAGRFEARSRVSTWLLAIARNLACSTIRQRPMEELTETMVEVLEDNAETPEAATAKNQQNAILPHCLTHCREGKMISTEADAWWLPDTSGTDYKTQHTKTTIVIQDVDVEQKKLGYFHNAGYHQLEGEDFDRTFRIGEPRDPTFLPLFAEFVSLDHVVSRPPAELRSMSRKLVAKYLQRRPAANPIENGHPPTQD